MFNFIIAQIKVRSFQEASDKFMKNFSEVNLGESFSKIFSSPLTLAVLALLLLALILIFRFSKTKFTAQLIAKIALTVALSIILNNIVFLKMPQGGSVTLASMLPIILIAFAYGPEVGFITGFIFGVINLFMGPVIVHPIQILLDYPLPYMFLGVAAYFRKHMNIGVIIAVALRFICHFISGLVFFGEYAEGTGMSPALYSFVYNIQYVAIELIIVLVLINILPINRLAKAINKGAQPLSR